ncbi:MAG TPA: hypothetical protein VN522_15445 [Solirubrobacterales bacterium]|nr:hypothetical protein [Solirubrobacterales bacterium]
MRGAKSSLAVVAALLFVAIVVSDAAAATTLLTKKSSWFVNSTRLATSSSQSVNCAKKSGAGNFVLKGTVFGSEAEITATGVECLGYSIEDTAAEGIRMAVGHGKLKFTGISVVKPTGCQLNGEANGSATLTTEPLTTKVQMHAPEGSGETTPIPVVRFEPTTGTTFANLKLTTCGTGTFPVEDWTLAEGTSATGTSSKAQTLVFGETTNAASALTFAGKPATFTGEATTELTSGGTFKTEEEKEEELKPATTLFTKKSSWNNSSSIRFPTGEKRAVKCAKLGTANFALTTTFLEAPIELSATGLECVEATIENIEVETVHMAAGQGKLKFTGVNVVEPPGCEVTSTLTTESLSTKVQMHAPGGSSEQTPIPVVRFEPKTGTKFAVIKITGCPLEGNYTLSGWVLGEATTATGTLSKTQTLRFTANTSKSSELSFFGKPATLTGESVTELASGEEFKVEEN